MTDITRRTSMSLTARRLFYAALLLASGFGELSAQPTAPLPTPPPATDVFLLPLANGTAPSLKNATPLPVATAPGYDNQPMFSPDGQRILFAANRDGRQIDVFVFDRKTSHVSQLTETPENENSPTWLPDGAGEPGGFSVVRTEADKTQRLWRFDARGRNPRLVLTDVKPVGYHAWVDAHMLALFVLGPPSTLRIADVRTGRAVIVTDGIGRSLQRVPGSQMVSFVQREPSGEFWIKQLHAGSQAIERLVKAGDGSVERDTAWMPDGRTLLMSTGTKVLAWTRGDSAWTEVFDAATHGLGTVSRIAVSPQADAVAIVVAEGGAPTPVAQSATRGLEGNWEGALEAGVVKLRLVLKVSGTGDGGLSARLDSVDQGATDLPVDTITLKGDAVHFEMKRLQVVFDGVLDKGGARIDGQFKQAGVTLPLVLARVAKPTTLIRPQEPKPPFPYLEEETRYENTADGVTLAGTLTLPTGPSPSPAAILITGSGPQNRNEELAGHKPFLVLADYLTRRGVAVLRVDDRGVGGSTGNILASTNAQFAADVLAGIAFLKGRKDIDPDRIGLIGHSEGGLVAPIVAAQSPDVAFIVLLAAPSLPGDQILLAQGELILKASGASADALARQRAIQENIFAIIKEEPDNARASTRIRERVSAVLADASEAERRQSLNTLEAQIAVTVSPWFRHFLSYDPRPVLSKVKRPVLALTGGNDLQVQAADNLREIEKALAAGGNRDVTVRLMPGLNHLFQTSKTGALSEYGQIEETFAPDALKAIGDWIDARGRTKG